MRLTIREFNRDYKHYKNNFDLELMLTCNRMSYQQLRDKAQSEQEWF